jgi:3-phenylpropionate/cinnamic acid dioxygenase small subunit
MSARGEIENALYRYAWAYDLDELELMGECFAEDAEVEFSTGVKVGREAVVGELERRRSKYRGGGTIPWHVISNVFIREETEQEATVASFYTFATRNPGGLPGFQSVGYYDDVFVNDGGVWRVGRRKVVPVGDG